MTDAIVVPSRFNGPPGSGNGGYVAGLVAARIGGIVEVTLAAPPPLDTPMEVDSAGEGVTLRAGDRVIASARPATLDVAAPPVPRPDQVEAMSRRFVGFEHHPFATCFVCGPARAAGDGLRIFAGRLPGESIVAAPWMVDAGVADGRDVPSAILWAAIDCPGYFAVVAPGNAAVLGRMTAEIAERPTVGECCTVVGWPLGTEGRKGFAGTALFGADGRVLARARQVWIELPPTAPTD